MPHRSLHLHFLQTPAAVHSRGDGHIAGLSLSKNQLQSLDDGRQVPVETGIQIQLPVDMLLKSIGYRGLPIEGVPFDDAQGVIPNTLGRVLADASTEAAVEPGLYTCGWVKRGPSGIIGTNIMDAEQTAGCLVADAKIGMLQRAETETSDGGKGLQHLLQVLTASSCSLVALLILSHNTSLEQL